MLFYVMFTENPMINFYQITKIKHGVFFLSNWKLTKYPIRKDTTWYI